jgi:CheY-like chemotaxis protein/predicted DNA-binding protein (UPF0251 family)
MDSFEVFREQLQTALAHLHDPNYTFAPTLCEVLLGASHPVACTIQSEILRAIGELAPGPEVPPGSSVQLAYEVLRQRFVLRLSQEEAAERLALSVRSLQRIQREATHGLARLLWERRTPPAVTEDAQQAGAPADWHAQVQQELVLLQESAPETGCDLEETLGGALRIATTTASFQARCFWLPTGQPITVHFHPTALRHVFVNLISSLARVAPRGTITVAVAPAEGRTHATFTAQPTAPMPCVDLSLAETLLSMQGGDLRMQQTEDTLTVTVTLPLVEQPARTTVLVVDDNADLVTLYRTYCAKTRFDLVHLREAKGLFETVNQVRPAIIVLDILLPDLDGWDILFQLHVNPLTQPIPVIVCSVVTDEQLVLDLGARLYLRKPVWRSQLLDAFDYVLGTHPTESR